jgi:uncharacterized membrane protein YccC
MMDRQATFLWMQDLLEHLNSCHEQWQLADARTEHYLADSMRRDLDELRRLCETLRGAGRVARGTALAA